MKENEKCPYCHDKKVILSGQVDGSRNIYEIPCPVCKGKEDKVTQNKLRLTPEEICKSVGCVVTCKPSGLQVGDCQFADKRVCTIYQAGSMAVDALLAKLASTPDEELVLTHQGRSPNDPST